MTIFYPQLSTSHKDRDERLKTFKSNFLEYFSERIKDGYSATGFYSCHFQFPFFNLQFAPCFSIRSKGADGEIYETDNNYTIRLEFNPNGGEQTLHSVIDFFDWLPKFNSGFLIKINRLDIAIDFPVQLNPWGFVVDKCYKSFYAAGQSGTQTLYHGSMNSDHMFRIYDKKVELLEKQKINYPGEYLWRIELVERESRQLLNYTTTLKNFFERVHLLNCIQKTNDSELDMVIEIASKRGCSPDIVIHDFYQSRKARSRLKNSLRSFERIDLISPAQVFDDQFLPVFSLFRTTFFNMLKSMGKFESRKGEVNQAIIDGNF